MLFSSLRKDSPAADGDAHAEPQFPSVIQLYSGKYIDFEAGLGIRKISGGGATAKYPYASLTYQCVSESGQGPTLGVWDCSVGSNESTSLLLKQVTAYSSTIILTVDLEKPNTVYSDLSKMLELLVDFYQKSAKTETMQKKSRIGPSCTTSIKMLASAKALFGKAVSAENKNDGAESCPDENISLVICGILPTVPENDAAPVQSFVEKQAHSLVHYHLHKFASVAKCALLFTTLDQNSILDPSYNVQISNEESSESAETTTETFNKKTNELKGLLEYLHISAMAKDLPDSPPSPNFHLPASHDDHVISEVMLRNATCEGQWDASKDSLDKALPPPSSTNPKLAQNKGSDIETEDEWLASLSSKMGKAVATSSATSSDGASVAPSTKSSSSQSKGKGKPRAKPNKNEPEKTKDVSDFFANLMTKKK